MQCHLNCSVSLKSVDRISQCRCVYIMMYKAADTQRLGWNEGKQHLFFTRFAFTQRQHIVMPHCGHSQRASSLDSDPQMHDNNINVCETSTNIHCSRKVPVDFILSSQIEKFFGFSLSPVHCNFCLYTSCLLLVAVGQPLAILYRVKSPTVQVSCITMSHLRPTMPAFPDTGVTPTPSHLYHYI